MRRRKRIAPTASISSMDTVDSSRSVPSNTMKKSEEERKEEEGKGKGNGEGKGKKPKNATSFNQAKNVRNNSQGGKTVGGNDTRNVGHPHGGPSGTGSMNYGPRPGLITQSSSGTQDPATSQSPAANHQLFTQPPRAFLS